MWISVFPRTICWRLSFSHWMVLHPCQKSGEGLFLGSLYYWFICLCLCHYHAFLIIIALYSVLKLGNVKSPTSKSPGIHYSQRVGAWNNLLSLSAPLQSEAAISNYSTNPQYLEDSSFLPNLALTSCRQAARRTHAQMTAMRMGIERWVATTVQRGEIDLKQPVYCPSLLLEVVRLQ